MGPEAIAGSGGGSFQDGHSLASGSLPIPQRYGGGSSAHRSGAEGRESAGLFRICRVGLAGNQRGARFLLLAVAAQGTSGSKNGLGRFFLVCEGRRFKAAAGGIG